MSGAPDWLARWPRLQYPALQFVTAATQAVALFRPGRTRKLESHQPVLIILGAGRSGNTLLRRLLMERGSIFIPPESYVWSSQVRSFLQTPAISWEDRVALVLAKFEYSPEFETFDSTCLRDVAAAMMRWPIEKRSVGDIILGLYHEIAARRGHAVAWVGEKTPMNLARAGLVSRMFPNARYAYIQRDGVDVAASYLAAGLYPSLEAGAHRWLQSHNAWRAFRKQLSPGTFVELTYEDLVSQPDALSTKVLDTFHVPRWPSPVDVRHLLGDVPRRSHHSSVLGEVSRPERRARNELTAAEREALRPIFGRALADAGYEPV